MAADDITKALLVEEVATRRTIAEALFASVSGGAPLLQALIDAGAADSETLTRYLARTEAPYLKQVAPLPELIERLPRGLVARLLAIPVRQDPRTGTVDVAVADPADPHAANEIAFHLGSPVRVVRASLASIEEALRRLRIRSRDDGPADRFREAAARAARERETESPPDETSAWRGAAGPDPNRRRGSLPPAEPALWGSVPDARDLPPRKGGLVIETDSAPPPAASGAAVPPPTAPAAGRRLRTPPWGTPVHAALAKPAPTEPPTSGYGSEIPIPLTRKTFAVVAGATQRPPAFVDPRTSALGEGYAFDPAGFRDVVEKGAPSRVAPTPFIPGPPPVPGAPRLRGDGTDVNPPPDTVQTPPSLPFVDMSGVLASLRTAISRDEILGLVLLGARTVANRVALFVVKKGGYHGWAATPEFADKTAIQSVLIPLDVDSVLDRAVREQLFLGSIPADAAHAPLLRALRQPSREVAAVPIRVAGKTAVIILADNLGDTMIGTRRLEELARAGGDAFGRIVRHRR
jgi:hypothetical protein